MSIFSPPLNPLCKINFDLYDKDFYFIINQEIYPVNKLFADTISPYINNIHKSDFTVDTFEIECDFDETEFEAIIGLSKGEAIDATKIDIDHMLYFFNKLGNSTFLSWILSQFGDLNIDNAVDILKLKISNSLPYQKELEFVAQNLFNFNEEILYNIDLEVLSMILSCKELYIPTEEYLFNFIINKINEDSSFISLLEFVEFRNLSVESILRFSDSINFEELNISIWKCLMKRLSCEIIPPSRDFSKKIVSIHYAEGNEMKGIFSYLTDQANGNIAHKNIISVSSTSILNDDDQFSPENVVDLESDSRFYSKNSPNQSLIFDFKNMRITPTAYSIRTQGCGINCCHIKSWVCELSEDGENWIEVDRQENSSALNGSFFIGTFPVDTSFKCRYARIRQTESNWYKDDRMILCGVEFYGDLYKL